MPFSIAPSDVEDGDLRGLMESAHDALDGGEHMACVRACADAYLMVLDRYPKVIESLRAVMESERVRAGLERGMIRTAPLMWPRFCAKLLLDEGEPEIVFDRKSVAFGEAIQYYEFTLDVIVQAQTGELQTGAGGGLAQAPRQG
jgi:hypothetical protein